jgi:hypothetical protein
MTTLSFETITNATSCRTQLLYPAGVFPLHGQDDITSKRSLRRKKYCNKRVNKLAEMSFADITD